MALVVTTPVVRPLVMKALSADASLLDFVEVSSGMDPLKQYEITQDLLFATTELSQIAVAALVGLDVQTLVRPMTVWETGVGRTSSLQCQLASGGLVV